MTLTTTETTSTHAGVVIQPDECHAAACPPWRRVEEFHRRRTCRMGMDAASVVGADLAVHDDEVRHVADASVMPPRRSPGTWDGRHAARSAP